MDNNNYSSETQNDYQSSNANEAQSNPQNNYQNNYQYDSPNQYNTYPTGKQDPVEFGNWMLTIFLTMIPVVNIIMLIVWAVSGETAPSKKNWAKAQIVWTIIGFVVGIIFSILFAGIFAAALGGWF